MIAFSGGEIDTDTLYHENMHQWWGDNVSEGGYRLTFFKEGLATLAEFLYHARLAENAAGRPSSPKGRAAFQASLVQAVQRDLRQRRRILDGRAVEPDAVRPVRRLGHLRPARCRLHRAAPDPRPRQLHRGAAADPAHLRRGQHQRDAARSRLPPVAARAQRCLPGTAEPVLHPVVRHRLPAGRRNAPAHDHRSWPGRSRLLRCSWGVHLTPQQAGPDTRTLPGNTARMALISI